MKPLLIIFFVAGLLAAPAHAEREPVRRLPAQAQVLADSSVADSARWIIKFRAAASLRASALSARDSAAADTAPVDLARQRIAALSQAAAVQAHGVQARLVRVLSPQRLAVRVSLADGSPMSGVRGRAAIAALAAADPSIESIEADGRRFPHVLPNDPGFSDKAYNSIQTSGQWHLKAPTAEAPSAIDAVGAWQVERGHAATVVAVLDTGVRFEHPDLGRSVVGGRLLSGYDFVSEDGPGRFVTANDGDGRDADAADPGDWLDAATVGDPSNGLGGCGVQDSSWHGTRVAGIIGAAANNGVGMVGIDWSARILPIRVLGRCGGLTSDIVVGMRWAGGLDVPGVAANPNPARVINLSLGGLGSCSITEQETIDELTAKGVVVVVSAGNEGGSVGSPANCAGALAVGGLRHTGSKVGYSSFGPEVAISAPAGNCVLDGANDPCLYSIDTTTNLGSTVPLTSGYTTQQDANVGTSFSAPMVAAVASLMLGANPQLTPAQVVSTLRQTARAFPREADLPTCPQTIRTGSRSGQCNCTATQCGSGMLDARAAVRAVAPIECFFSWAERSFADILAPTAPTEATLDYAYRYYSASGAYLGFSRLNPRLYFLAGANLLDLGTQASAMQQAGCPVGP